VDVYSFGLTMLEIAIGNCRYINANFPGSRNACLSKSHGGFGYRPPVPRNLAESQPLLTELYHDCVVDDFNARPTFVEIAERLELCEVEDTRAPGSDGTTAGEYAHRDSEGGDIGCS